MSDASQRPIVIKRKKKHAHEHHGGAWKIAYADFVTAMMAFFLLMWLLGSTTKAQLKGISEYFQTPLKVAMLGGEGSGDATSLVKGGGDDLTKSIGQDNKVDSADANPLKPGGEPKPAAPGPSEALDLKKAQAELERVEKLRLEDLKVKLEKAIDSSPLLTQYKKQILLDITSEGLRVQIVDEQNRPMFASGGAQMKPYTRDILREIGRVLNTVPNRISLSGHTDAAVYAGGERGYSNWELSADRANSSRRELIAGGMEESKMMRVVGLGSAVLFDKANPLNPVNRRISIMVMNRKAEDLIRNEGSETLDVKPTEQAIPDAIKPANPIPPPITLPPIR